MDEQSICRGAERALAKHKLRVSTKKNVVGEKIYGVT